MPVRSYSSSTEKLVVTSRVRAVFVAVIGLLGAQCVFVHFFGEPYPAVAMPTFSGSGGYRDGSVELQRYDAVFVADDGKEFSFGPNVLLAEFPDGHRAAIAANAMRPRDESLPTSAPGSRVRRIRDAIFPGFAAGNLKRNSPENQASLEHWLRGRAQVLVPGHTIVRAEIRWYRVASTFGGDGTWTESKRTPDGTLVVRLAGESR
jgi:hypothetical protein